MIVSQLAWLPSNLPPSPSLVGMVVVLWLVVVGVGMLTVYITWAQEA